MHSSDKKLEICKQTRKFAADSLYKVLKKLLASNKPISETLLRDAWIAEMQKNKNIFPNGWYDPPPHGIIVLFADDKNVQRINFKSARPQEYWPRSDTFLNIKTGIALLYASPVDKATGIIGDFQMSLYFGKNTEIQQLLKTCLLLDKEIFDHATIGMKLAEVADFGQKRLKTQGLSVESMVLNTKAGMNFGHSIPATDIPWSKNEQKILQKADWIETKTMISNKRLPFGSTTIQPGFAFTIEPRPAVLTKPYLPTSLSFHTIALFKKNGEKELLTNFDELFTLAGMEYMIEPMKTQKISYESSGVNYESLDPAKTLAQKAGSETAIHLKKYGFEEVSDSRGESAFVWKQKNIYMASVTESLGTKNLVADAMRKLTGKTYYDIIGYDTMATALNDLTSVGAKPLVTTAFWAVGNGNWFDDIERTKDLVNGWKKACDDAGVTWGGGESPAYNNIVNPETIALGGNVVGIISSKKRLLQDNKLKSGDRILLLKSTGINANGLSLARAIAKKLSKGYATKLTDGTLYGEAILRKTNIYAQLIQTLLNANIDIHYISNITGHGLRKIMRGRGNFTYILEKLFEPQALFNFIQKHAGLSDYEMYETYNMGQDYAIFLPEKDVKKAQVIIKKNSFESLDAGYIEKGKKQVILEEKNITFSGEALQVRI